MRSDQLKVRPQAIIVDGNRFTPYHDTPYTTIIKVMAKYQAIAAASILAKTYRDDYMDKLAEQYPMYDWQSNKGYPTRKHRDGIRQFGISPFHRKSYNLLGNEELPLDFKVSFSVFFLSTFFTFLHFPYASRQIGARSSTFFSSLPTTPITPHLTCAKLGITRRNLYYYFEFSVIAGSISSRVALVIGSTVSLRFQEVAREH